MYRFGNEIISFLVIFPLCFLIGALIHARKSQISIKKIEKAWLLRYAVTCAYFVAAAAILLLPKFNAGITTSTGMPFFYIIIREGRYCNFIPFATLKVQFAEMLAGDTGALINLLANAFIFMPLPIVLLINNKKASNAWVILISLIMIATNEALQYPLGRSLDVDDIILNFAGMIVGLILVRAFIKIIKKKN